MKNIVVLDELTINKIAAGEVIERPASVIKEMVENSIDAGATQITVEIRRGGITYMRVTDNGSGIAYDDVLMAFEKHATSKITCGDDLDGIETLGFRGEALASISAISKVEMTTKVKGASHGVSVVIHGGNVLENTSCGAPEGTTFVVNDLFYNTPARYKFLKKDATEAGHIIDLIERMALAHPEIAFKLKNNASEVIRTRGDGILKNVIYSIYGKEVTDKVKEIDFTEKGVEIEGFAGGINSGTANRVRQSLFINGRYVRSKVVYAATDEAYKTLMMKGKYPLVVMNINISPKAVDVNVHPSKMEVRFSDDGAVFRYVNAALGGALFKGEVNLYKNIENGAVSDTLYATPFDVKTKAEVREERAVYNNSVQELPVDTYKTDSKVNKPDSARKAVVKEISDVEESFNKNAYKETDGQTQKECKIPNVPENAVIKETCEDELSEERDILKNSLYIGQAFNTFIILQYKNEIVFIDQHAAHERIKYEKIKKSYEDASVTVQTLLTPVIAHVTQSEFLIFRENEEYFSELGFKIEDFGDNSLIVREIPVFVEISDVQQIITDILYDIKEDKNGRGKKRTHISDDVINMMACKLAIKANHKLNEQEVKSLLESLLPLNNPFTCLHGRPTVVKMSKYELEKKFKRIL